MDMKRKLGDISVKFFGAGEIYRDAIVKWAHVLKRSLRTPDEELVVKAHERREL
jgi:hypothetical protein